MRKKVSRQKILKEKKAASPAISMVVITAATVMLVLIAGSFATQVLDRQQASTEFNAIQKSILALDDAVRDIAWKESASRSVRFTTSRGTFQTISTTRSVEIKFNNGSIGTPIQTSIIKYIMPDSYIALEGEDYYILGKPDPIVSSVSDSLGQVWLAHEPGFVSISLGYRVRVSNEGNYDVQGVLTSYVNIYVIRLSSSDFSSVKGDFDIVARNTGVTTNSYPFTNNSPGNHPIHIFIDGQQGPDVSLYLTGEQVIFNVIISNVSLGI